MLERAQVVEPRRASTGLTIFLVAEVLTFALWEAVDRLQSAEILSTSLNLIRVETGVDTLISAVACAGLFMVAATVRPSIFASAAAWTWSIATVYFLASSFMPFMRDDFGAFAVTLVSRLFAVAMRVTMALLLVQLASWRYRWIGPVMIGVVALGAINAAWRMFITFKMIVEHDTSAVVTFSKVTAAVALSSWVTFFATAVCVFFARLAVLEAPTQTAAPEWTSGPSATTDLVIGGVMIMVAFAVTVGSFLASAGGGYVVTIGLFVFGIARLVRGLRAVSG